VYLLGVLTGRGGCRQPAARAMGLMNAPTVAIGSNAALTFDNSLWWTVALIDAAGLARVVALRGDAG
jgi:hypothetical protein